MACIQMRNFLTKMEPQAVHAHLEAIFQSDESMDVTFDFEKELIETAKQVIQDVSESHQDESDSEFMNIFSKLEESKAVSSTPHCSKKSSHHCSKRSSKSTQNLLKTNTCKSKDPIKDVSKSDEDEISVSLGKLQYLLGLDNRNCDSITVLEKAEDEAKRLSMQEEILLKNKNELWKQESDLIKTILSSLKVIADSRKHISKKTSKTKKKSSTNSSGNKLSKKRDFLGFNLTEPKVKCPIGDLFDGSSDSESETPNLNQPRRRNKKTSRDACPYMFISKERNFDAYLQDKIVKNNFVGFSSVLPPKICEDLCFSSDSEPDFQDRQILSNKYSLSNKNKPQSFLTNFAGFSGVDKVSSSLQNLDNIISKGNTDSCLDVQTNPSFLLPSHGFVPSKLISTKSSKEVTSATSSKPTTKRTRVIRKPRLPRKKSIPMVPKAPLNKISSQKGNLDYSLPFTKPQDLPQISQTPAPNYPADSLSNSTQDGVGNLPLYLRKNNRCPDCGFESPILGVFKRHQLSHSNKGGSEPTSQPNELQNNKPICPQNPIEPLLPSSVSYTYFTGTKEISPLKSGLCSSSHRFSLKKHPKGGFKEDKRSLKSAKNIYNRKKAKSLGYPTSILAGSKQKVCKTKTRSRPKMGIEKVITLPLNGTRPSNEWLSLKASSSTKNSTIDDPFKEKLPYIPKHYNFLGFRTPSPIKPTPIPDNLNPFEPNFIGFTPSTTSPLRIRLRSPNVSISIHDDFPKKRIKITQPANRPAPLCL